MLRSQGQRSTNTPQSELHSLHFLFIEFSQFVDSVTQRITRYQHLRLLQFLLLPACSAYLSTLLGFDVLHGTLHIHVLPTVS